jgi:hypothetical protein
LYLPKLSTYQLNPKEPSSHSTRATTAPQLTQRQRGLARSGANRYSTARATSTSRARMTQRPMDAASSPAWPSPRSSITAGKTAIRTRATTATTIAPRVSSSDRPRSLRNPRVSRSS